MSDGFGKAIASPIARGAAETEARLDRLERLVAALARGASIHPNVFTMDDLAEQRRLLDALEAEIAERDGIEVDDAPRAQAWEVGPPAAGATRVEVRIVGDDGLIIAKAGRVAEFRPMFRKPTGEVVEGWTIVFDDGSEVAMPPTFRWRRPT